MQLLNNPLNLINAQPGQNRRLAGGAALLMAVKQREIKASGVALLKANYALC